MSSIGGPNSIRDGLVLYLDAANVKSFRGEPTTNNANQSITVGGNQVSFSSVDVIGPEGKTITASKVTIDSASGTVRMRMYNISNVYPVLDQYYTISVWVKRNNNVNITGGWESELNNDPVYTYARPGVEIGYTGVYGAHPNTQIIPSEWTRVVYTFKYAVQPTAIVNHFFYFSGLGGEVLFYGFQFEEKSYETSFVIGTRGTTVEAGGGLIDLSRNGNNGTVTSGITYSSENGGSLSFDGVSDYVLIQNSITSSFSTQGITTEAWVYNTSLSESNAYISNWKTFSSTQKGFLLRTFNGQTFPSFWWCWGSISGTSSYSTVSANSAPMNTNQWYHIIGVYEKGVSARIYVNGVLKNTNTSVTYDIEYDTTNAVEIGNSNVNSSRMNGNISIAKIYNRALTASEILQNYNASKSRFGL